LCALIDPGLLSNAFKEIDIMTEITPRIIELDIQGQICPSTLLVALREMNSNIDDLNSGSTRLVIKSDNRDATNTIPEAAASMGLQVTVSKSGAAYTILIFK
jgi:TusA-related sulfurtransferase